MAWQIELHLKDPHRYTGQTRTVGPYNTRNDARWWAVNFAQKGSVSWHQGLPDEEVIPVSSIVWMGIREE